MGSSPVVPIALLTLASVVLTVLQWHHTPHKVPIWWDLHAHPWLLAPRWLSLLLLPVLTFVVPYALYQTIVSNNLESHGSESKQSITNIVVLPALFLFVIQNFVILPSATNPEHMFEARLFVFNIALWLLIWFGHNIKHVEANSVIGIISPWTTSSNWETLHQQAGLIFEVSGVLLLIAAWFVPIGWPLLVVLLVLWLGPWIVSMGIAYSYASNTVNEPLIERN